MDPRNYPVLSATLIAPVVAWLTARYLPGLELSDEQATVIATGILAAGSFLATSLVRTKRTLPDPEATRSNSAVEVRPTTYRVRDDESGGGYQSGSRPASEMPPPTTGVRRDPLVRPPARHLKGDKPPGRDDPQWLAKPPPGHDVGP